MLTGNRADAMPSCWSWRYSARSRLATPSRCTAELAQAQPAPIHQPTQAPPAATAGAPQPPPAQAADAEPIGNVATLTGTATVTRNNASTPLKLQDDIFLNDVLQTVGEFHARRHLQRRHHLQSHRQCADHDRQLCL